MLYVNEIDQMIEEYSQQQDDWFEGLDILNIEEEEQDIAHLMFLQDQAY